MALKALAAAAAGIVLGMLLTWASVSLFAFGTVKDGPWRTSLTVGSPQSGPYLRAYVALHGLFALKRSEAIYYDATHDSDGGRLNGACIYRVAGRDPDAAWWSLTAYGADDFLIPNAARRYSVSTESVMRRGDNSFVITVSQRQGGANWIAAGNGPFSLTLRLYHPGAAVAADPAKAALPEIRKESCR
ncbi:MAG: DUF1214 domain-containing protein [Alphaproteobacteria bacterium]|nr:DUF1214 domain-containing protein [Alphaproteobacteria bacterium]MDE2112941.1 DUF1214 domain-containing protein [Alphaproteobacteria bacterium]MDE2495915.1 DUF1214 domain-containing protein [Alphaproteobacteria bacterium]